MEVMTMKKTYHFSREDVKPNDIFYAEHYDLNGEKFGHYFYCVYAQHYDQDNKLFRDVLGLLITTREVPGYTYKMRINDKDAYVCLDSEFRFVSDTQSIQNKHIDVSKIDARNILKSYKRFCNKKFKQMKGGKFF